MSMQITDKVDLDKAESILREIRKDREPYLDRLSQDEEYQSRLEDVKNEGAAKLVDAIIADPALELSIIFQMAFADMEACDIGQYVKSKVQRMIEERALLFCSRQAD